MNGGEDPQNTNHHHHNHQNTNHHNHGDHGDDDEEEEEEECVNGGCRVINTILQSIATSSSLSRPITVTMSVSSASPTTLTLTLTLKASRFSIPQCYHHHNPSYTIPPWDQLASTPNFLYFLYPYSTTPNCRRYATHLVDLRHVY